MKDRLREDLLHNEEIDHVGWLEDRRNMAEELAELGCSEALALWKRLNEEIKFFLSR